MICQCIGISADCDRIAIDQTDHICRDEFSCAVIDKAVLRPCKAYRLLYDRQRSRLRDKMIVTGICNGRLDLIDSDLLILRISILILR